MSNLRFVFETIKLNFTSINTQKSYWQQRCGGNTSTSNYTDRLYGVEFAVSHMLTVDAGALCRTSQMIQMYLSLLAWAILNICMRCGHNKRIFGHLLLLPHSWRTWGIIAKCGVISSDNLFVHLTKSAEAFLLFRQAIRMGIANCERNEMLANCSMLVCNSNSILQLRMNKYRDKVNRGA